ncbi:tyrosine-type recombinase/integrase [Actinomadura kijaniata]|uniref:tyrosine-type recombinase/integrase n=1 Tax=Actinomadura kijaniata TaxID=46161 RepID=UPI00082E56D5|nr:tyrosine-type recombinase/integrase [Actinomadura kijaniata]
MTEPTAPTTSDPDAVPEVRPGAVAPPQMTPPGQQPVPALPTIAPTDATHLRHLLVKAVAVLPALPAPDPSDRYGLRQLTVLWLERLESHHTRRAYWRALSSWLTHCQRTALDPVNARIADVDAWLTLQTATGRDGTPRPPKPNTLAQRKAALSSWYTYLIGNQAADHNPAALAKKIKTTGTAKKAPVLSQQETAALLDHTEARARRLDTEAAWRDAALIALLFYTGVRVSAVTGADVTDFTTHAGYRILRYAKKGGGRSFVRVEADIIRPLERYLQLRAARLGMTVAELDGPLLATTPHPHRPTLAGGKRLVQRDVSNTIRTLAKQADLPAAEQLSPHSGRGTVITTMLATGVSLRKVQDHVEHADPRTTADYDQTDNRLTQSPVSTLAATIDAHRHAPHDDQGDGGKPR